MKRILYTLILALSYLAVSAQDEGDGYQTIFGKNGINRISGFGGPFFNYSVLNGQFTMFSGGGGGVILDDFYFGGYGMSTAANVEYRDSMNLSMSYGGLMFGYTHNGKKAFHPSFFIQTGWGKLKVPNYYSDNVFVINPCIELEMNVTKFFRVALGANYRIVGGLNTDDLKFSDVSGPGVNLMFKFGWF